MAFSVIALHLFTIIEMDNKYAFLFEIILFKKAFPDVRKRLLVFL